MTRLLPIFMLLLVPGLAAEEPPVPGGTSSRCRFELHDGTRAIGRIDRTHLTLVTTYGPLDIPLSEIFEIRFAERVDPEFEGRVKKLVASLGDASFTVREEAQQALARIGARAARLLEPAAEESGDLEVQARVEELLADMHLGDDGISLVEPPLEEDEVVTGRFTARGELDTESFELTTPYGVLQIAKVHISRIYLRSAPRSTHVFTISGEHTVNRDYVKTAVALEPGDLLKVSGSGTIHVRNWGRRFTPEGDPNYGTFADGIPIGALIGRLGDKGDPFLLGAAYEQQILRKGVLQLAMAFDDGGQGDRTSGSWKIRVTVLRGHREAEEE